MDRAILEKSPEYKAFLRYEKMYDDGMYQRMDDWFKAGKSDDIVMGALGLNRLSFEVMRARPNYKYYVRFFLLKTESQHFKDWLKEGETGLPTYWSWKRLGLVTVDPATRAHTTAYEAYVRYAKLFDDAMYERVSKDRHQVFSAMIGPYPEETNELVRLWAAAKRPDWYAQKMLGSTSLGKQYFEGFFATAYAARAGGKESRDVERVERLKVVKWPSI